MLLTFFPLTEAILTSLPKNILDRALSFDGDIPRDILSARLFFDSI